MMNDKQTWNASCCVLCLTYNTGLMGSKKPDPSERFIKGQV